MIEAFLAYMAIVGALLWLALVLLPWRPWNTREQLEQHTAEMKLRLDDITALIPARNESKYIQLTLEALHKQGLVSKSSW